uniref:Zgc:136439 n=2 Tax=Latimeria chalumnae TaxID=7897 RepID=M3XHL1_LATCH
MVIGGDTLFFEDFSLTDMTVKFLDLQRKNTESNLVLSYLCKDEETTKYGILEVDENLKVTEMKEKPAPNETESRRACPCFYMLSKETAPLIQAYLEEKKYSPIEEKDAPGNLISWLVIRKPVYVHHISGRFDVGNLSSYIECDKYFQENFTCLSNYLQ